MTHPSGSRRRHAVVRSAAIVAALVAALITSTSAPMTPRAYAASDPAPLKAVIIVGPTHSATSSYLAKGEALADLAESYGMDVRRVFHPYATWSNLMDDIQGANLVAYFGHGNGWPSPYAPFQEDTKNGFGLNEVAGGSQNTVKYYGANKIRAKVVLAPNAIVLLNNLCYAEGNGEPGMGIPSYDVARQRVDNYAAGFLAVGARGVFAYGWQTVRDVLTLLFTTHQTLDGVFTTPGSRPEAYYGYVGWNARVFDSVRTPGMHNHLDPDPEDGYLRAFSGDLEMTTDEWLGGSVEDDALAPVVSEVSALQGAGTIVPSDDSLPVFTPNGDGLGDVLTLSHTLSEGAYLEWTVAMGDGTVVRRFSTWAEAGPGTSSWDGRRNSGAMAADGRYVLTVTPKDRAGNVGGSAAVAARVLTSLRSVTAAPSLFFARDLDALAPATTLSATLTRQARVDWEVVDEAGDTVRTVMTGQDTLAGALTWTWDGLDDAGALAPDGTYRSIVGVTTDAGSYSHQALVRIRAFWIKGPPIVSAGERITYEILGAEPIEGWPTVTITQPGLAPYRVSTVRYSPMRFTFTVTFRSGGTTGPMAIKVVGTDTGGQKQRTTRSLTLR